MKFELAALCRTIPRVTSLRSSFTALGLNPQDSLTKKLLKRMPQERLPKQALHAKANGRRPVGRPRTRWTDYIEDLGWNRLGLRPSEMMEVMEDREVWRLNLELLPPQPSRKSGQ